MKNLWLTMACLAIAACVGIPTMGFANCPAPGMTWQEKGDQDKEEAQDEDEDADDDEELTPKEEFRAMAKEYKSAMTKFRKAYATAEKDERRAVVDELYPNPADFAKKMIEFAKANADDEAALDALSWVVTRVRNGAAADQALDIMLTDHIKSEKMFAICGMLAFKPASEENEAALQRLIDESPHDNVKGMATMSMANYLKRNKSKDMDRIEALYQTVLDQYGDVKVRATTLAKRAEGALFEIRNLQIGMVAPNIEGSDFDGVEFQLEDYRGKVVVIDFWGDW